MLSDFKKFVLRGNVVDLAVAVVVGVAFTAMVTAFVADLITPLIAAIFGKPDFSSLTFTLNHSHFKYGSFLNALLSFLIVATVVFFAVVVPLTALMRRLNVLPSEEPKPRPGSARSASATFPSRRPVRVLHFRGGAGLTGLGAPAGGALDQRVAGQTLVEDLGRLFGPAHRQRPRVEKPDLHQQRRLVPVDVLLGDLVAFEANHHRHRELDCCGRSARHRGGTCR